MAKDIENSEKTKERRESYTCHVDSGTVDLEIKDHDTSSIKTSKKSSKHSIINSMKNEIIYKRKKYTYSFGHLPNTINGIALGRRRMVCI